MWDDLGINLVASAIWTLVSAALGALAYNAVAAHRRHFGQERGKLTYYRVLRLSFRERDDAPYYQRVHHSKPIADAEGAQPVYDEVWCLNASFARLSEVPEDILITSSGIVDAIQVLPVVANDADNHPHSRSDPRRFTASHRKPTSHLMAAGTLVNGLQNSKDWWFGTTAQHDGQTLTLVVDFSSLPFAGTAVRDLHALAERGQQGVPREELGGRLFEERISNDIFVARLTGTRKNDVLKVRFAVDRDRVPQRFG